MHLARYERMYAISNTLEDIRSNGALSTTPNANSRPDTVLTTLVNKDLDFADVNKSTVSASLLTDDDNLAADDTYLYTKVLVELIAEHSTAEKQTLDTTDSPAVAVP